VRATAEKGVDRALKPPHNDPQAPTPSAGSPDDAAMTDPQDP
jgi:hypothetical protein